MRSLAEPEIDDFKLYDDIAAAKHPPRRKTLEEVRDIVATAYLQYKLASPRFEVITAPKLSEEVKTALHHCFASETKPFAKVRSTLTAPLRTIRCPFCGVSEASTLDHYLPKELHPVYSVYSRNLVPCCPQCNARKSTKLVDKKTAVRRFLHPYFDTIPTDPFLTVSIVLGQNLIRIAFKVVRPQGLPQQVFAQLKSHFEDLSLRSRYNADALLQMREQRHAFARWFDKDGTGERLSEELIVQADDREADYGANDWLCVLYRKLACTQDFVSGGFQVIDAIQ